ncbi:MAG: hypothetical protein LBO08_01825 [Rickettsiales bacterium]|jgi:ATP-dependent helicase/nuclease subunit A|nr:hypothetical protein [Rickettsiales bacterium]
MTKLQEFLQGRDAKNAAVEYGTRIHARLQFATARSLGDIDARLADNSEIARFFGDGSRAEVPIAGIAGGRFVSRRIDRLLVGDGAVEFLDYKTDADHAANREKYARQMAEYAALLRDAFPGHEVRGWILYLSDCSLESF